MICTTDANILLIFLFPPVSEKKVKIIFTNISLLKIYLCIFLLQWKDHLPWKKIFWYWISTLGHMQDASIF